MNLPLTDRLDELTKLLDAGCDRQRIAYRLGTTRANVDQLGTRARKRGLLTPPPAPDGGLAWQEQALCAQTDPEAFFPEKGGSTRDAKRICAACPVRAECLDYALTHTENFGVWGGLSERERRHPKKQRRAAA